MIALQLKVSDCCVGTHSFPVLAAERVDYINFVTPPPMAINLRAAGMVGTVGSSGSTRR